MVRRVILCSEVKDLRSVAEVKASVNSTKQLHAIDPKPGDLSIVQAEVRVKPHGGPNRLPLKW